MLLMIDNYDSFTYNLVQYFGELGETVKVVRNDQITIEGIKSLRPDRICISPGPCSPKEAGISINVIETFAGQLPILGVCLGHQAIGAAYGGSIIKAKETMHGKIIKITHNNKNIFTNIPSPYTVTRYNSLTIDTKNFPSCLEITATAPDGDIMGISHKTFQLFGVQFHPESILSEHGYTLLRNFIKINNDKRSIKK
ncbi:Anthranilate synthase component 2 [Candidatus Kinetoplastibacterium sorsogonicusi]|uniref:Anthranilate synthase component 2 n=1 Tax=Candidatus Kinetoplastidibacterium kentomonadis TaxID=1576550 RepID=A0A3Q8EWN3_9PROT|nr:aminodeoxychorismate/anthranilate synthase component II [Candidatus Kinetoplastibacterium sorsogonicusi]AWD32186.1 Anthranilate synthase component 2 [Candidatus Kinetoplastibacterium sorsogonicusi]